MAHCNTDEKIEGLKVNETLVMTLEILDDVKINAITLTSTGGADKINGHQIENRKKIKLKIPQKREGTFKICVYTNTDISCSQDSYVEGGYRPNFNFSTIRSIKIN